MEMDFNAGPTRRAFFVSLLLFGSGICALVYQTVWLREFRLIFGTSTAASAAVLSIFMGGLGAGGIVLGKRADRSPKPLRFYASLELLIAVSAALSPFLLSLVRAAYLATGGSTVHSRFVTVIFRLLLSALVLALPTFLMGGTLPAAGRAVETTADSGRRRLALIYATNTLGAVVGVVIPTFYLLERFGNRTTLWFACALNVIVALTALAISGATMAETNSSEKASRNKKPSTAATAPLPVILVAAAAVGFIFFLMEIVWYRMMAPLLGGSTFTFGLILAVALFGVGLGSAGYAAFGGKEQPHLSSFAITCAAEAFFIALPFALGDRIAVLALLLRPLGAFGFQGHILAWTGVTALVVLPAAIVAGIQFPMLIALLGKGRARVAWHTGLAYACNTLGAITGSLAGGFGLLPALTATGVWRLCVIVLVLLGAATWIFSLRRDQPRSTLLAPVTLTILSILLLFARGPTAAWRQSPVGAGRADERGKVTSRNATEDWLRTARRYTASQVDGRESGLGIYISSGISFLINGKSDGHAVADASTQVMCGLLGAILNKNSARSLVVGLGTGSTAGWLAAIPSMERVDVVELEAAVLKVAEACAAVNQNFLANSKARIHIGDAREWLLTTREKYDLIVSEPSNPYRAGVASLYTREYYKAAARTLRPGGLFLQFVQAYEVDGQAIQSIYATFNSVFPVVETWQTGDSDLLFVGSLEPIEYDVETLRRRIADEPFKSALTKVWRVTDLEALLSHYVANDAFAKEVASDPKAVVNTDDRNLIEFSFARTVGTNAGFTIPQAREEAHRRAQDRPSRMSGYIDWTRVDDQNAAIYTQLAKMSAPTYSFLTRDQRLCAIAESAYVTGNTGAMELWRQQPREASSLTEWAMMAELLASDGNNDALPYIQKISDSYPAEASMLLAILRARQLRFTEASEALLSAYEACRVEPWPMALIFKHTLDLAIEIVSRDNGGLLGPRLYRALEESFAVKVFEADRRKTLLKIGRLIDGRGFSDYTLKAIAAFEPDVPWEREFLQTRAECYRSLGHPLAAKAARDLTAFVKAEPAPFLSREQN